MIKIWNYAKTPSRGVREFSVCIRLSVNSIHVVNDILSLFSCLSMIYSYGQVYWISWIVMTKVNIRLMYHSILFYSWIRHISAIMINKRFSSRIISIEYDVSRIVLNSKFMFRNRTASGQVIRRTSTNDQSVDFCKFIVKIERSNRDARCSTTSLFSLDNFTQSSIVTISTIIRIDCSFISS
jgi:hypothetical protein